MAGAVVLAGGRSSRMGRSKADLEWHGSTLLRRVVGLAARGARGPVVVVRAPGQLLPALPAGVAVVEDQVSDRGPLQGLAAGLAALQDRTEAAFVCATDLPFLHPAYVRRVLEGLGGADVALPTVHGFRQPLAASYRTSLATRVAELLEAGSTRPADLLAACDVVALDEAFLLADPELVVVDPSLDSVRGVNDVAAYDEARARPAPQVEVLLPDGTVRPVRAATLGAAAAAAGVDVGDQDPSTPLAEGDRPRVGGWSA